MCGSRARRQLGTHVQSALLPADSRHSLHPAPLRAQRKGEGGKAEQRAISGVGLEGAGGAGAASPAPRGLEKMGISLRPGEPAGEIKGKGRFAP